MSLPRGARLEFLVSSAALAALVALTACGSADGTTPATCVLCEGALCNGVCTDLSAALAAEVKAGLPASSCVPKPSALDASGVSVCSAQLCGGQAPGCAVALTWSPALLRDAHRLEGTVTATSDVDAHLSGIDCVATLTATFSYAASAAFACAPGVETATFGTITTTPQSSAVSLGTCGLLATWLNLYLPTFTSTVQTTVQTALARATTSVTATCPSSP